MHFSVHAPPRSKNFSAVMNDLDDWEKVVEEFEFCGGGDADDVFTTFNYGGLETTLRLEWLYVVDPERGKQELARLGLSEYPGLVPMKTHDGGLFPKRDNGRQRPLESFVTHEMAERAKLRKAEVVGLRLHTGPSYMHIVRFE